MNERYDEVHAVGALVTGALFGAFSQFVAEVLVDASVEPQHTANGERVTSVDVVLQDGWRIRFTPSIVPPGGEPINEERSRLNAVIDMWEARTLQGQKFLAHDDDVEPLRQRLEEP